MEASLDFSGRQTIRPTRRLRVTQKRIDANRRNAACSTGPRTPEGKARVRLNALRHGFRARDEICLAAGGEDAQRQIAEKIAGLTESLHPAGPEESAIVAEIALNMWKANRAFALDMRSRWWEMPIDDPGWPRMRNWVLALVRYDNRANRGIYRGFAALRKAQRLRGASSRNGRTKPLAPDSRAASPGASEGPHGTTHHRLKPLLLKDHEDQRTKPLSREAEPNTLRALTLMYWERERARAMCSRWRK